VVLVRNAIARKIEPVVQPSEDEPSAEVDHPGYGGVPADGEDTDHTAGESTELDDTDGAKEGGAA
jgi:hypothetical protein